MGSIGVVLEDKVAPAEAGTQVPAVTPNAKPFRLRRAFRIKSLLSGIYPYFEITAIATHIWTVIIAVHQGGFLIGLACLILPGPAEVYWIFKLFGDHPIYVAVAILHLLLVVPIKEARKFGRC